MVKIKEASLGLALLLSSTDAFTTHLGIAQKPLSHQFLYKGYGTSNTPLDESVPRMAARDDVEARKKEAFHRSLLTARLQMEGKLSPAANEEKDVAQPIPESSGISAYEFHRSLLEARLKMEAANKKKSVAVQETVAPPAEEELEVTQSIQESNRNSAYEFHRSLLEARLKMEAANKKKTATAQNTVAPPKEIVEEPISIPAVTVSSPLENSEFDRLFLEAQELQKQESVAVEPEDTNVAEPEEPILEEVESVSVEAVIEPEPVVVVEEIKEPKPQAKAEPVPEKPKVEKKKREIKLPEISAEALKPEKGVMELKEELDEVSIFGSFASNLAKGVAEGAKATFMTFDSSSDTTASAEELNAAAEKSTKALSSAAASIAALGLKLGDRTIDYAKQRRKEQLEEEERQRLARIEAEKIAEEERKAAELKRMVEEARMTVDAQVEEKRAALKAEAVAEIQEIAKEAIRKVQQRAAAAESKAFDEIKAITATERKQLLLEVDRHFEENGAVPFFASTKTEESDDSDETPKSSGSDDSSSSPPLPFFATLL